MPVPRAVVAFLWTWGLWSLTLLAAVWNTEKLDLHRAMHGCTAPWLDGVMRTLTHVADGWTPTIVAVMILLLRDVRSFLMMGLSCALSAIVTQVLKRVFDHDRPAMFKEQLGDMHWVPGVDLHHYLSFPSGHATAAFSMCLALAVLCGRRAWGFVFGLSAIVLAYTRVYLSQHFTEDILAGGAIGTLTALAVYHVLYRSGFAQRTWLARRVLG